MQTGPAPINEITAAGLIQLSGWDAKSNLFDPMCGSGTFIIEAAMAAMNIPAGYYREGFGFENWPDFDQGLFDQVKREADDQISEMDCRITGSDFSPKMIDIALENLKKAHLHKDVELRKADFFNSNPAHKSGMLIFNPPYDLRMKNENIFQFYKSVGDKLKSDYQGYTAWIISGNHEALKNLGLKPSKKFMVYNGPVASQFACYEMFKGADRT